MTSRIEHPSSIIVTSTGELIFADTDRHRICKVDTSRILTVIAGNGTPGFSGDGDYATKASLNKPTGVALAPNGDLYIADSGNHRVRLVSSKYISTVAGCGVAGYDGDGDMATRAKLNTPTDVAVSANNDFFITDRENNVIRKVSSKYITSVNFANKSFGMD